MDKYDTTTKVVMVKISKIEPVDSQQYTTARLLVSLARNLQVADLVRKMLDK